MLLFDRVLFAFYDRRYPDPDSLIDILSSFHVISYRTYWAIHYNTYIRFARNRKHRKLTNEATN
jgi:hypothetical protein